MFNGILKTDDVEVYEMVSDGKIALSDMCKSNIFANANANGSLTITLPTAAYVGKIINITSIYGIQPTGKTTINSTILIQHSNTTLFTLKQGTVSFMYVGQALNGLTATASSKSGWIILGGVQGDTTITGYAGSVAIGSGACCGSPYATAIGCGATASLQYSTSIGGSRAGAQYSTAVGYKADAATIKIALKANERFSVNGDAQAGKFILMRQTTNATPLVMSADNIAASTTNILILPNNGTYAFKGIVVAKDATTLDSAMWEVTALMKRGANASTTAIVGTPTITKVFNDVGASAWSIALTADTTNGGGAITVTGEAGKTIRWVSNIDSAEVI